jgi:hypothetical protein
MPSISWCCVSAKRLHTRTLLYVNHTCVVNMIMPVLIFSYMFSPLPNFADQSLNQFLCRLSDFLWKFAIHIKNVLSVAAVDLSVPSRVQNQLVQKAEQLAHTSPTPTCLRMGRFGGFSANFQVLAEDVTGSSAMPGRLFALHAQQHFVHCSQLLVHAVHAHDLYHSQLRVDSAED